MERRLNFEGMISHFFFFKQNDQMIKLEKYYAHAS